ncbi:MAG: AEC family transporter [Clostridia bacterium]
MALVVSILEMTLPVLVMLLLGLLCKQKKLFAQEGLAGIKSIVGNITLPVVLFNAFFTADYTAKTALSFAAVFTSCGIALALGFALRRFVKPYGKFMPLLMTGFEGGMLGYALFGLLYGAAQLKVFAMVDVGQTMFAYTVFLSTLKVISGQKPSVKGVLRNMFTNPACVGMMLGIVLGLTGVGKAISGMAVGRMLAAVTSFVAAPTAGLILIIVGYELSLSRKLMKPVLCTVMLRLMVMMVLMSLSALLIFSFVPFEKELMVALLLAFSLPAPFIIPLYADVSGHGEYISATLSVSTILSIVLFVGIAAYSIG